MYRLVEDFQPSYIKAFKVIFLRQILLYWRDKFFLLQNLSFFMVSILIFKVTANISNIEIYLVFLLFSLTLSSDILLIQDYKKKILQQFLLLGVNFEVILLAKIIAHILFVGIPFIIFILFCDYLMANEIPSIAKFFLLLIFVANIVIANLFSSALCITPNQSTLSILLMMPFVIPNMIFGALSFNDVVYVEMLIGIFLIEAPIFLFASAAIIKNIVRYHG